MVNVFIDKKNEWQKLEFIGTVGELCSTLELNKEEVIVTRSGELLLADDNISANDEIKILYVLSGG